MPDSSNINVPTSQRRPRRHHLLSAVTAVLVLLATLLVAKPALAAEKSFSGIDCTGSGSQQVNTESLAAGIGSAGYVSHQARVDSGLGWHTYTWTQTNNYQVRHWVVNWVGTYYKWIYEGRVRTNSGGTITYASRYCVP